MDENTPKSLERIRELLSNETDHSIEEVLCDSNLEEDLSLNLDDGFSLILLKINREFDIELDVNEVLNELDEVGGTVCELAKLIDTEMELG